MIVKNCTKRQNLLYIEVRKLFSEAFTDVPALLPLAMLPRQARVAYKNCLPNLPVQFLLSLSNLSPGLMVIMYCPDLKRITKLNPTYLLMTTSSCGLRSSRRMTGALYILRLMRIVNRITRNRHNLHRLLLVEGACLSCEFSMLKRLLRHLISLRKATVKFRYQASQRCHFLFEN